MGVGVSDTATQCICIRRGRRGGLEAFQIWILDVLFDINGVFWIHIALMGLTVTPASSGVGESPRLPPKPPPLLELSLGKWSSMRTIRFHSMSRFTESVLQFNFWRLLNDNLERERVRKKNIEFCFFASDKNLVFPFCVWNYWFNWTLRHQPYIKDYTKNKIHHSYIISNNYKLKHFSKTFRRVHIFSSVLQQSCNSS